MDGFLECFDLDKSTQAWSKMFIEDTRGTNVLETKENNFGNYLSSIEIKQRTESIEKPFV